MFLMVWATSAYGVTLCEGGDCDRCVPHPDPGEQSVGSFAEAANAAFIDPFIRVCAGRYPIEEGVSPWNIYGQPISVVFDDGAALTGGSLVLWQPGTAITNWQVDPDEPAYLEVWTTDVRITGLTAVRTPIRNDWFNPAVLWFSPRPLVFAISADRLSLSDVSVTGDSSFPAPPLLYLYDTLDASLVNVTLQGAHDSEAIHIEGPDWYVGQELSSATLQDLRFEGATSARGPQAPLVTTEAASLAVYDLAVVGPSQQILGRSPQSAPTSAPYRLLLDGGALQIDGGASGAIVDTSAFGAVAMSGSWSATGPAEIVIPGAISVYIGPTPPGNATAGNATTASTTAPAPPTSAPPGAQLDGLSLLIGGPAITIEGASFEGSSLSIERAGDVVLRGVQLDRSPVTMDGGRLAIEESEFWGQSAVAALALEALAEMTIENSAFCGSPSLETFGGASLSLRDACLIEGSCSIEGTLFADTSGPTGGAIDATSGHLDIRHSSFLATHGLTRQAIAMSDGDLSLDRVLFAEQSDPQRVIGGPVSVTWSSFDRSRIDSLDDGAIVDDETRFDLVPELAFAPDGVLLHTCDRAAVLADTLDNRWLVDNRIGAFAPCWLDNDGDGFGGLDPVYTAGDCDEDYVAISGDCQDGIAEVYPGNGCWLDADNDKIGSQEDCDDTDPKVGQCALRLSGGCDSAQTRPSPAGLLAWSALWLSVTARARRSRSS